MKISDEKLKKIAELKKIKEEKQKEKELKLKEEAIKKQKKLELRLVEAMAKRKLADEKKLEKNIKPKIVIYITSIVFFHTSIYNSQFYLKNFNCTVLFIIIYSQILKWNRRRRKSRRKTN